MGKEGILVEDSPGFVSNRVLMLTVNEAVFLVHEGVAPAAEVDRIFKTCFGHPMGPLETTDLIGLDTILLSIEVLHESFNDSKYRPCPRADEDFMTTRSEDQVVATGEGPAQKVRAFLSRYFRNQELRDDEDMFAKKIINSVAAMDLVLFIEKQFSIKLEPGDLKLDNFRTIGAIVAMIERKTQSHAA